ncbi:hypothetical protein AAMO2058_001365400 [Amorphochlora amoebiformis]
MIGFLPSLLVDVGAFGVGSLVVYRLVRLSFTTYKSLKRKVGAVMNGCGDAVMKGCDDVVMKWASVREKLLLDPPPDCVIPKENLDSMTAFRFASEFERCDGGIGRPALLYGQQILSWQAYRGDRERSEGEPDGGFNEDLDGSSRRGSRGPSRCPKSPGGFGCTCQATRECKHRRSNTRRSLDHSVGRPVRRPAGRLGWSVRSICSRFPSAEFRLSDTHDQTITLRDFKRYCDTNKDRSPIAIYDSAFADAGRPGLGDERVLAHEYKLPQLFNDDLYNYYHLRPPWRWILLAPQRSGTGVHLDPLLTSAWLALFSGRKRWVFFPPNTDPGQIGGPITANGGSGEGNRSAVESIDFFTNVYPKLIRDGWRESGRMLEVLQRPGEIVYVPPQWWHVVLNLDDTAAITHNYLSRNAFSPQKVPHTFNNTLLRTTLQIRH